MELKGLAVGAQVDIIVFAPNQVQLYSKGAYYSPPQARADVGKRKLPNCVILPNKYGRQNYDLPAEAVSPATRFLLYDGIAHYYAAYRKSEVDGSAAPSAASEDTTSLHLAFSGSWQRSQQQGVQYRRAATRKQALLQHKSVVHASSATPPAAPATLSPVDMEAGAAEGLVQMRQPPAALQLRRPSSKERKRLIATL